MDPVEPWIDADSVRRMAAQLISAPKVSKVEDRPDAGFGPSFEGYLQEHENTPAPQEPSSPFPKTPAPVVVGPPIQRQPENTPAPQEPSSPVPKTPAPVVVGPPTETEQAAAPAPSPKPEAKPNTDEKGEAIRIVERVPVAATRESKRRGPLHERMERFRRWLEGHAKARGVFVLDRDGNPVLDDPKFSKLHFLARSLAQAYRPVDGQAGNVHVKVGADAYLVVVPVETAFGCLVLGAVLPAPLDAAEADVVSKALAETARPERL